VVASTRFYFEFGFSIATPLSRISKFILKIAGPSMEISNAGNAEARGSRSYEIFWNRVPDTYGATFRYGIQAKHISGEGYCLTPFSEFSYQWLVGPI